MIIIFIILFFAIFDFVGRASTPTRAQEIKKNNQVSFVDTSPKLPLLKIPAGYKPKSNLPTL